ncbi:MAG: type II toxin-antitoxin system HicB family antitoxin [Holophagales bacterium]|nr:type II toxin-antitoxin system HicB family antitoxin [Holophagales bacterium]
MKLYRLEFVLKEPSEETEGMYLAEVPALPGCRAWGKTAALALENLQSVTAAFIESHRAHGDPLPPEVAAAAVDVGGQRGVGEVMVAV